MGEITNWLDAEINNLDAAKSETINYPEPLKLAENKITEIEVDFSKPFEKKPNKINPENLQALIPVKHEGKDKTFWLNIRNPLFGELIRAGSKGISKFKIFRIGTKKDTKYKIVE